MKKPRVYKSENHAWSKATTLTFNGRTLKVQAWSDMLGIGVGTINQRIRAGMPTEEVLAPLFAHPRGAYVPKGRTPAKKLTHIYNGKRYTKTVQSWATQLDISADLIYKRLREGMTIAEALAPARAHSACKNGHLRLDNTIINNHGAAVCGICAAMDAAYWEEQRRRLARRKARRDPVVRAAMDAKTTAEDAEIVGALFGADEEVVASVDAAPENEAQPEEWSAVANRYAQPTLPDIDEAALADMLEVEDTPDAGDEDGTMMDLFRSLD